MAGCRPAPWCRCGPACPRRMPAQPKQSKPLHSKKRASWDVPVLRLRHLSNIMAAFGLPDGADAAVIGPRMSPASNKGLLFHRLPEYFVKLHASPDIWSR
ncbi:hypothetical protein BBta_5168 [Bradyrhizobium sp. BTAi1]|nr:hypothetical protein BBta_5168 [Bradyrhizobium sp. BTAi1]